MIFNKTQNGSLELKELIGFIYKSINFSNLKSYIGFAERDIIKIIGSEVFNVALNHYRSSDFQYQGEGSVKPEWAILDELVLKIQFPVAILAYRRYVPSNDVSHGDRGRQIFVGENEKPAFEWQIEKDNENLLSLAHEATDILLEFLDDHIDDMWTIAGSQGEATPSDNPLIPWGTSNAYLVTRKLLIPTVQEFEKVFLIGHSRATFLSLAPIIYRVQENEIKSCLTSVRYDALREQFIDDDLSDENKIILEKITQPLALLSLSIAVKRLSSSVLPAGIFTGIVSNVINGKNPATKVERNEISSSLERDGLRELVKLQEHIRKLDMVASGITFTTTDPSERIDTTRKFVRL